MHSQYTVHTVHSSTCIHTMSYVCRAYPKELDEGLSFWLPVSKRCQPNGDPSMFSVAEKLPCHRSNGVPQWWEEPSKRDAGVLFP